MLMNRFDATLVAQVVPAKTEYTLQLLEWISTIGILAATLMARIIGVRFFSGEQ